MQSAPIYSLRVSEVFETLETTPQGISDDEAAMRRALYGDNLLSETHREPLWHGLVLHFVRPHALIMFGAAIVAAIAGDLVLAGMIAVVELGNTAFGYWREYRAEQAIEKLRHILPAYAHILRDGQEKHLPANELAPGDVLILAEGDNIAADARVVEEYGLRVNNAALTGEAMPARKSADASLSQGGSELERHNLIFAGTSVASGTGRAVVYATGMLTQFGRIAHLTQTIQEEPSAFQLELQKLIRVSTLMAFGIGTSVGLVAWLDPNVSYTFNLSPLLLAIGIIVAVIPEGMPATLTLSLAAAAQRLAGRNVLVKKLNTIETLGAVSVICTDKSGTLTQNQMTVREIWVARRKIKVTGVGCEPVGTFSPEPRDSTFEADFISLMQAAACCNNSRILPPVPERPTWSALGDQTEAALKVAAQKAGWGEKELETAYPRVHEIPFDARRKRMSTIHRDHMQETAFVKGSPREVLQLCSEIQVDGKIVPLDESLRAEIMSANDEYARKALRVLAIARRHLPAQSGAYSAENVERNLTFLGLTAMMDPPRPEVEEAIATCRRAGIRIVMITGDYGLTAESLARRVGMLSTPNPLIITGAEVETMSETDLERALENEVIFARMAPEHKMRLVNAFQARGDVVAVTGDGVNDAPALRKADVGVAMGIVGTDVAKESADIILTSDNFGAIVAAIEEGRAIFDNIRKFMTYIFASNVPEVLPFVLSASLPVPQALTARQVMAVDMGTDMIPALALGMERPEPDVMNHPPRRRGQPLLDNKVLTRALLWLGSIEAALCFAGFYATYVFSGNGELVGLGWLESLPWPSFLITPLAPGEVQLMAITAYHAGVVMAQMGNLLACRTQDAQKRALGFNKYIVIGLLAELVIILVIVYVPPFQGLFQHNSIPAQYWLGLALYPFIIFGLEWTRKQLFTRQPSEKEM